MKIPATLWLAFLLLAGTVLSASRVDAANIGLNSTASAPIAGTGTTTYSLTYQGTLGAGESSTQVKSVVTDATGAVVVPVGGAGANVHAQAISAPNPMPAVTDSYVITRGTTIKVVFTIDWIDAGGAARQDKSTNFIFVP